jgi:hypothetical protein
MGVEQTKEKLRAQLARCKELALEFPHGVTAKNIKELSEEIQQQLRALEK